MDRSDTTLASMPRRRNDAPDDEPGIVSFGRFTMLPDRKALLVDGAVLPMGARAFDILQFLIAHRDRFNSRDQIRDHVWRGLSVADNNVSVQIWRLRRCLASGDDGACTIVCLPGHGYRFVAPLEAVASAPTAPRAGAESTAAIERIDGVSAARPATGPSPALMLLLVAIGCFCMGMLMQDASKVTEQPMAVMPGRVDLDGSVRPAGAASHSVAAPTPQPAWIDADDADAGDR